MNTWRIAGMALLVALGLFLLSVVIKLLIVGAAAAVLFKAVGKQIARRYYGYGSLGQGRWATPGIVSIDNPAGFAFGHRSPMSRLAVDRIVPIG